MSIGRWSQKVMYGFLGTRRNNWCRNSVHFFVVIMICGWKDILSRMNIRILWAEKIWANGKKFLIGHGDGLGPGDHGYKFMKKIFRNKFCQWLLDPAAYGGSGTRKLFQSYSRAVTGQVEEQFWGEDNEWLVLYCKKFFKKNISIINFCHRHFNWFSFEKGSRYINLGDWLRYYSYAVFDDKQLTLTSWYPNWKTRLSEMKHRPII